MPHRMHDHARHTKANHEFARYVAGLSTKAHVSHSGDAGANVGQSEAHAVPDVAQHGPGSSASPFGKPLSARNCGPSLTLKLSVHASW